MDRVDIPEDFLSKIYLGRCGYDYNYACASPEGRIADFNVWDRFLSTEQLMDWTSCK